MGVAKIFLKMKPEDRIKYAMAQKREAEKQERFWAKICRKLSEDKKFTPMELDFIDSLLDRSG